MELFPTVVRNMARAVCNIGSRLGSVIAPQVAYLRHFHFALPYIIFGIFSTVHVIVCLLFLPETKGKPIQESLPTAEEYDRDIVLETPILNREADGFNEAVNVSQIKTVGKL